MRKLAVIGLGTMGRPMATHLARTGFDVTGVDTDAVARRRFAGALRPSEVDFSALEAIVTILPEGEHVQDAYERWILPSAKSGTALIECSTIDIDTAKRLHAAASGRGLSQIDAPVSGGPEAAGAGWLSMMVGGHPDDVRKAQHVLETLAKKISHFGAPGSGQAAKACHNMICGVTAMAVMEGFALAEALGLDPSQFHALCSGSAAQSWTLENRCPVPGVVSGAPASNGYAPGFAARLMAKDLRLAHLASDSSGQATPFGEMAAKAFTSFADDTGGDLDFSSYYEHLRIRRYTTKDS